MTLQYLIIISIWKVREGTAPFYESENEIRETGRTVTRGEKGGKGAPEQGGTIHVGGHRILERDICMSRWWGIWIYRYLYWNDVMETSRTIAQRPFTWADIERDVQMEDVWLH